MADKTRKAVVTGLGVISPLGSDLQAFEAAVLDGRSGIKTIDAFDPSPFRSPFGGTVEAPVDERLTPEEMDLFSDPYLRFAVAAARSALGDAGLSWTKEAPQGERTAIVVGTCNGGLKTAEEHYRYICGIKPGTFTREMNTQIRYSSLGRALAHCFFVTGPTWVVTTACSSSTGALGLSLELIAHGVADTVLTGGVDALCLATLAGFNAIKATSTDRTAPFSVPPGLNLGEGAGFWVVEEKGRALSRGARIRGEILGYAFTSDAYHPTAPDPRGDGAYRTMSTALQRSGVEKERLGCISAHGTGTEANDRTETKAIAKLLGGAEVPIHSFKSQVGHCLGAAGILEATAALVAMENGAIPATINFTEPRPGCNLDYVPNTPRKKAYDTFLSSNYAFGGNNASVVVGSPREDTSRVVIGSPREDNVAAGPQPERRTVITGLGAVTPFGLGVPVLTESLLAGEVGFSPIEDRVRESLEAKRAGLVPPFTSRDVDRRIDFKGMNRVSRYATGAARLALGDASLRVGPKEGKETGIVNGVYVGPDEEAQMVAVIRSGGAETDIGGFSQIVANAIAGWASNALMLKGYTTTVAQGYDAGLYAVLASHMAIKSGQSSRLLAGASDELFPRYLKNYDELGYLCTGDEENNYALRLDTPDRRVLGEGAAYILAEEADAAKRRGARTLAEVVGYGMTTDPSCFYDPSTDPAGLARAIEAALEMAGWASSEPGLVVWSPQGNRNDAKVIDALGQALGPHGERVPMVTSTFQTGIMESASGVATLTALLHSWREGKDIWPQRTGISTIDERPLPSGPVPILALAAGDLGLHLALAIAPRMGGGE